MESPKSRAADRGRSPNKCVARARHCRVTRITARAAVCPGTCGRLSTGLSVEGIASCANVMSAVRIGVSIFRLGSQSDLRGGCLNTERIGTSSRLRRRKRRCCWPPEEEQLVNPVSGPIATSHDYRASYTASTISMGWGPGASDPSSQRRTNRCNGLAMKFSGMDGP
jgi:hypothetical protein